MPFRCCTFCALLLSALPVAGQRAEPLPARSPVALADSLPTWDYKHSIVLENVQATGEWMGDREIARGTLRSIARVSEVEFARGDILVSVDNEGEGRDPEAYLAPIVAEYGLVYADTFGNPIPNAPGEARHRKARLTAPDDRAFLGALRALKRLPFVRYAAINMIGRLH